MLDVDGRHHVNAHVEQIDDVLVPLLVLAGGHVRMRELVDDRNLRFSSDDGVDVHFFHRDAAVLHVAPRHDLEVLQLRVSIGAAVRFHESDDDVETADAQRVPVGEHRVGLADARRRPDVNAQARAIPFLQPRQQRVASRSRGLVAEAHFLIGHCSSSARFSSNTFTRGSPRNPNCRGSMCASTSRRTSASLACRAAATRGA